MRVLGKVNVMSRSTKKKNNPGAELALNRRIREGVFILVCALALFLAIALVTYNAADPGWSRATNGAVIINRAGAVGAWAADLLFSFCGYMAYIFPVLATIAGFMLFKNYVRRLRGMLLWSLHLSGLLLIMLSGCALLNLLLQNRTYTLEIGAAGGILGSVLTDWSVPRINILGSALLFSSMLMVGITIGMGVSWLRVMEWIGKATIITLPKIGTALQTLWQACFAVVAKYETRTLTRTEIRPEPKITSRTESETRQEPRLSEARNFKPETSAVRIQERTLLPKKKFTNSNNKLPDLELLQPAPPSDPRKHYSKAMLENLSREVEERLLDFGAEVKVVAVCPGPIVTRFEMTLAPGLKVSKITGLAKDLARSLSVTSVRVVEVIPGKAVVGLEIPNQQREIVKLRDVLESPQYQERDGLLNLALGKDIAGVPVVVNLDKMPHLLVAGTTGSGKSVGVNVMLLSLLFKATAADLRLILIDPKMLELSVYDGIGHLLTPVVTDMNDAANALRWCVAEMERRYQLLSALGVRNLAGFNAKIIQANIDGKPILDPFWEPNSGGVAAKLDKLPYIVVIIDEFADMMMVVGKKVEELIARIAQKARAAGIHLILATQRPSVDVITGLIKANIPTRIAFQVSSRIDSRTILDQQGAEQLLGYGDMLYLAPGAGIPTRVHGAFVSDEEVHAVVNCLKQNCAAPEYIEEIASDSLAVPGIDAVIDMGEQDPLYDEAVSIVTETRKASISYLQRRLKIGYNRSARLIEAMESAGLVSEMLSNGSREVLALDVGKR